MAEMIASRPFRYGSLKLARGDRFEARNKDVRVLMAIGKAMEPAEPMPLPTNAIAAAPVAPPRAEVAQPVSGDIDALRAQAEALGVKVDMRWRAARLRTAISDADAGGGGRYLRRDMTAEE